MRNGANMNTVTYRVPQDVNATPFCTGTSTGASSVNRFQDPVYTGPE